MWRVRYWFWHVVAIHECRARFGESYEWEMVSEEEYAWYRAFMARHGFPGSILGPRGVDQGQRA